MFYFNMTLDAYLYIYEYFHIFSWQENSGSAYVQYIFCAHGVFLEFENIFRSSLKWLFAAIILFDYLVSGI